ncbi:AAA family ATPase [Rhodobacter ferrooxidans]|uniref:AAA ATPase n=1 Tax=Rhodobacter ferrooxidans TaxID=371731 RepID=C8S4U9_9RHOB|nr:AAA family ATPase [Rhodobacter sp. SW2]EEW24008.1 conserved hypothetical protein [Rhodobacter sp. SW2]
MSEDPFANVTPMKVKRGKRAQEIFGQFTHASHIEVDTDPDYLIKGWIAPNSISVMYGQPNVGKTFLALDMAQAVASGRPWAGSKVRRALVIYITLEGGAQFDLRVKALDAPEFWVLKMPLSFLDKAKDSTFLCEALFDLSATHGPVGLVVIDTLARAMTGGDENSSQDMGKLIAAVDLLKERTRAHVMLIHHMGKNAAQGARGHSSLRAAIDTEIELTKEAGQDVIEAKATKQRDMPVGKTFPYVLRQVAMGQDRDGDDVTTCVVERAAGGEKPTRAKVTGKAMIALQALQTALERHGLTRQGPDYPSCRSVTADHWKEACATHGLFEGVQPESERKTFSQAKEALLKKDLARCFDDVWWLT